MAKGQVERAKRENAHVSGRWLGCFGGGRRFVLHLRLLPRLAPGFVRVLQIGNVVNMQQKDSSVALVLRCRGLLQIDNGEKLGQILRMGPRRKTVGSKFSEGARLLWGKIEGRKLLLAEAARKLKWPRSTLARVLYGERLPGVALLADVARVFRVPMGRWAEPPTVAFVPPGARGLKPRRAA